MTELERVEIEGFKGLKHAEFEPSDINLITGRNNTGKTSFLEAVDLLFNPANLEDFGDNLDSVIHKNCDQSEVQGRTEDSEVGITIQEPSATEAGKYFFEAVPKTNAFQTNIKEFLYKEDSVEQDESNNEIQIHDVLKHLDTILRANLTQESMDKLRNEIIVLSTATDDYPCFLGGTESLSIMQGVLEELQREFDQENIVQELEMYDDGKTLRGYLEINSRRLTISLPPRNTFTNEPRNTNSATSIKSVNSTNSIERTDDDQEPIKIDDIGDFLKEKEIVDNLKTFTLDYLVFEENGEKHQIPFEFMGDGFKSIVGLLWELMDEDVKNDIVLIEEPENHMHPGYVLELVHFLIDLAKDEDIQFFITTHDHDFIKDFFADMPEEKREYLEDEFSLVRMDDFGAEVLDYETAEHDLKDLHLDLRGI